MTLASVTPHNLDTTTELLRTELPRLEEHQQTLEKELAAVTERLESVRSALAALQALSLVPHVPRQASSADTGTGTPSNAEPGAAAGTDAGTVPESELTPAAAEEDSAPVRRRRRTTGTVTSRTQQQPAKRRTSTPKPAKTVEAERAEPSEADRAAGLTEQVIEVLSRSGGSPVRARDVAEALGRDDSAGSVNAVRSTLDRLVATSRADRAGRGLYQAR